MAEIKDVYSLEFNGSQFQSELDSAIAKVEELNSAMADGADIAGELEDAQSNLVSVLGMEAKGVEQLNQKRDALVKTQKTLNNESKTGVAVGKQLDATNKQIAVSTGQAATQQKSFAGSLLQGARNINSMRRAGMLLGNVFRMLGGLNPFGLLLTAIPAVISYITGATNAQKSFNEAAEAAIDNYAKEKVALDELFNSLSDVNIKGDERSAVIDQINQQYGDYLPNLLTEASTAEEIAAAYDLVNQALIRKAVTQAKTQALEEATAKLLKQQTYSLKEIAESEAILEEQRKKGYGKLSQGARDNLKRQKQNIEESKKQYKEELKVIDQASKDLEKALGLTAENSGKRQVRSVKKTQKDIKDIYNKIKDDRLKSIQDELKNVENALKIEILKTEENTEERLKAELQYIDILEALKIQYKNELGLTESEISLMQQENINKRKELFDNYYKFIKDKREKDFEDALKAEEEYQSMLEDSIQKRKSSLNELTDRLNKQSDIEINILQRQLNNELNLIEQQRNERLKEFSNNAEEQQRINEFFDKRRLDLEKDTNNKILNEQIKLLGQLRSIAISTGDESLIADIDKQISELELKITELGKTSTDTTTKVKGLTDKQKELIEQTATLIQGVSDNVFNVLNAQVQAYISGLDKAIDKSKSALDEIRSNSEDYNARQLEIEKERLEKLEAERARAVEREKTLAQVQIAINAAIAVSKAAVEGAGVASAVTIALTLASLVAGLAQARVAAGNAFFKGVEYLERGNNKAGRDTIPAMLNEGERVITTDTNDRYWDVLTAVHNNRIPANVLNTFAKAYQQGGIKNALGAFGDNVSLSSELGQKSIFVNVAQTYGGLENRLERIEAVLTDLPKYMPRTTVTANANGIFKIVEQRQARKNYSRNWSK